MRARAGRVVAATGLALAAVLIGVTPAHADETPTETETFSLGDLDASGSGSFDKFDPALGTLTAVKLTADVSLDFSVCVTNLSQQAATLNSGSATGTSTVTFAGAAIATAEGSLSVPGELLDAAGEDGCSAWLNGGADPSAPPAGTNSALTSGTDSKTWSATLTDPAALAPYIGTGTVAFDYTASSASDLAQPAEWTLVFLASGAGEATVTYVYEPGQVGGIREDNPGNSANPANPAAAGLPDTGGPWGWLAPLGGGLLLAGMALVLRAIRNPHTA